MMEDQLMARSPLFGRRIHIAGSIVDDVGGRQRRAMCEQARELIAGLVKERW